MSGKILDRRQDFLRAAEPVDLGVAQFLDLARAANVTFVWVDGRLVMRVGAERRECGPGDVVTVAAGEWHGFQVLEEAVLEVVAEQRIGTVYPVRAAGGGVDLVEVHRPDMPWGRAPRDGTSWTDDVEMRRILDNLHPGT